MFCSTTTRFRWLAFAVAFIYIVSACSQASQPVVTLAPPPSVTPSSTIAPTATFRPTSTTKPSETNKPAEINEPTVTPLPEIALNIELPEGDAESGKDLAIIFECRGCHNPLYPSRGPQFLPRIDLPSILERGEVRIASPDYRGKALTNQEYIIESVYLPEAYTVPGEWRRAMPTNFMDKITHQELADILAWMATLE